MEIDGKDLNQLFQFVNSFSSFRDEIKDQFADLKLSHQKEISEVKTDIAVLKNTQDQGNKNITEMKTEINKDISEMKTEINNIKKDVSELKTNQSENKGEKNRNNYFMDKMFWPFLMGTIMILVSIFINMAIINTYKPIIQSAQQGQQPNQQNQQQTQNQQHP